MCYFETIGSKFRVLVTFLVAVTKGYDLRVPSILVVKKWHGEHELAVSCLQPKSRVVGAATQLAVSFLPFHQSGVLVLRVLSPHSQ